MIILVADDEDLVRSTVVRLLEFLGHEIVEVASGKAALSCLRERDDIELALLDEQMPGLRGSEVLEELRVSNPQLPVLLSSGSAGVECDDPRAMLLSKPYHLDKLGAAIAKVCSQG